MDFGKLLGESWERFLKEIVNLVLFTLLGAVLCITIILIPTVAAGWARGFLKYLRQGVAPEFNELWSFEDYLQVLLLIVVMGLLVTIGYVLLIVPGVILSVWWLYALFYLVDKKAGFWEAMSLSREAVGRTGFFNHLLVLIIFSVLNSIGSSLAGLGWLLTCPFSFILLALVYQEISGGASQSS